VLSRTGVVASFCRIGRNCVRTTAVSNIVLLHLVGLGTQRFLNGAGKVSVLPGGSASFSFRGTSGGGRLCVGRQVNQWSLGGAKSGGGELVRRIATGRRCLPS
jgi:hypothetical protein